MHSEYIIVSDSEGIREVFGPFAPEDVDTAIDNVQAGDIPALPTNCKFFVTTMSNPDTLLIP